MGTKPTPMTARSWTALHGNYCGPGWGFTFEDVQSGKIAGMPEAINAVDRACAMHDDCYGTQGYLALECNVTLVGNLADILSNPDPTAKERRWAAIVAAYFAVEVVTIDAAIFPARVIRDKLEVFWRQGNATMADAMGQVVRLFSSPSVGTAVYLGP